MPRSGSILLRDLRGHLNLLRVECGKCGRKSRTSVTRLIGDHGAAAGLSDVLVLLSSECPRRTSTPAEICGVHCPDLVPLSARLAAND